MLVAIGLAVIATMADSTAFDGMVFSVGLAIAMTTITIVYLITRLPRQPRTVPRIGWYDGAKWYMIWCPWLLTLCVTAILPVSIVCSKGDA